MIYRQAQPVFPGKSAQLHIEYALHPTACQTERISVSSYPVSPGTNSRFTATATAPIGQVTTRLLKWPYSGTAGDNASWQSWDYWFFSSLVKDDKLKHGNVDRLCGDVIQ